MSNQSREQAYATMDWAGNVVVTRGDGKIYYSKQLDRKYNSEYWLRGDDWPTDPLTGDKLPIYVSHCTEVDRPLSLWPVILGALVSVGFVVWVGISLWS